MRDRNPPASGPKSGTRKVWIRLERYDGKGTMSMLLASGRLASFIFHSQATAAV